MTDRFYEIYAIAMSDLFIDFRQDIQKLFSVEGSGIQAEVVILHIFPILIRIIVVVVAPVFVYLADQLLRLLLIQRITLMTVRIRSS